MELVLAPEMKQDVIGLINDIAENLHYHGKMLNERYLHHYFSFKIQENISLISIVKPEPILVHPEWPTSKKSTNLDYGKYKKVGKKYMPVSNGTAGFIDFTIGDYSNPFIGIEFSLKSGWSDEEIVYDFVKLMDAMNPFKLGISYNVILREHEIVSKKRLIELESRIQSTVEEAKKRLEGKYDPDRELLFIISEISRNRRRHWIYDQELDSFTRK